MNKKHKIQKENILLDLEAKTKEEVITIMATKLFEKGYLSNLEDFIAAVFERESHMSTGVGNNLAIPHGKSDAVCKSTVAVAKLATPIEWVSLDDKPVNFVFLLAIENEANGENHLRILAELSGKLMDDAFVEQIKQVTNIDDLYEALAF